MELQAGMVKLRSDIFDTIADLRAVNRKMTALPGNLGPLQSAYSDVEARITKEQSRIAAVDRVAEETSQFLSNTVLSDANVARLVRQNKERFFNSHEWLRPVVEEDKPWWQQAIDAWNSFWGSAGEAISSLIDGVVSWVKDHAVELIIGAIGIVVGAVVIAISGGAAALIVPALLAGLKVAATAALTSAVISAVIASLTGRDPLEAFGDGLASGFMWGGILFAITSIISVISAVKIPSAPSTPTAQYGDTFGKMGTYVEHPGTKVDWSQLATHGPDQMMNRGLSKEMVERIVENGKALSQAGGAKHAFVTQEGVVVLSREGKIVTCWAAKDFNEPMKKVIEALFGSL